MSVAPLKIDWATGPHVTATSRALGEPDWLLAERHDALAKVLSLPGEPNQLFTPYHDLRAVDFGAIEPYSPTAIAADAGNAALPDGAAALVHVEERRIVGRVLGPEAQAAGVVISTIEEAARSQPDLLRPAIEGGISLPGDDAFGQVARALSSVSIFVHVPDGVTLAQPIVLRWRHSAEGYGLISRTVVVLGKGAHATIFEEQLGAQWQDAVGPKQATSFWWGTTEVELADGARLDFAGEQDFGSATATFVTRKARVGADATISWAVACVGSRFQRSRIDNELEGRGASVKQAEIGFGDDKQLFDLTSYTRHSGEDTTSDLLSKGIFSGKSRGYIKGMIEIARSAKGTDTFLGEFSMLLERTARSVTVPSLEIDQPNVRRAMHSSSVGP
ncbi:MAG: SufD family Fe-S cluster assembly protein, partial [Chloroflexota bacterium]